MIRLDYAIFKYQKRAISRIKSSNLLPDESFHLEPVKDILNPVYLRSQMLRERSRLLNDKLNELREKTSQFFNDEKKSPKISYPKVKH